MLLLFDTAVYGRLRVQVDNEDYYDGPDDSEYETDDSNGLSLLSFLIFTLNSNHYWLKTYLRLSIVAEDHPQNDYPDEISEEEDGASECDSEESEHSSASDESTDEDLEHHGFSEDVADPLYDEEFDDYECLGKYDGEDGDEDVDVGDRMMSQ